MAFGIRKQELENWKTRVSKGEISVLTHYWLDPRFPEAKTVTKVGCSNLERLVKWGESYGLRAEWIDRRSAFPHFDLFGDRQIQVLTREGCWDQLVKFKLVSQIEP